MVYLVGYIVEKYNYIDEEFFLRVKEKISSYIDLYIYFIFFGYILVNVRDKYIYMKNVNSFYVLFFVWMVSYDYERVEYIFVMNG